MARNLIATGVALPFPLTVLGNMPTLFHRFLSWVFNYCLGQFAFGISAVHIMGLLPGNWNYSSGKKTIFPGYFP